MLPMEADHYIMAISLSIAHLWSADHHLQLVSPTTVVKPVELCYHSFYCCGTHKKKQIPVQEESCMHQ